MSSCDYATCDRPPVEELDRWLAVPGASRYDVSRDGQVRSRARGGTALLTCAVGSNGYRMVAIWYDDGTRRNRTVHGLIAEVLLGTRPDGADVRHLDGNCLHNCLHNLAYGTRSENVLDIVLHGRHNKARLSECRYGHPLDGDVLVRGNQRLCRICARRRNVEYQARRKQVRR